MDVPILRTKDKVSFMIGVALLMVTEFIFIAHPNWMWLFYSSMIFPLLITRFFTYHKSNFHYFMLDFCYYMQIWAILAIFVFPNDIPLFKVFFGLCNGPLLAAIIMWQNKMVFHDLDKLTSLFIHIYPPLLSYAMRWHTPEIFQTATEEDFTLNFTELFHMVVFYVFWQILYILKTEWLDAIKFQKDETLMSSARWLSSVHPHPLYTAVMKRGWKVTPTQVLVPVQLVYTIFTLIPMVFMYQNKWVHLMGILIAFGCSTWFGACYYFESFTDNYTKRLEEKIGKFYEQNRNPDNKERKLKYLPNSKKSVVVFILYFLFALVSLLTLLRVTIWWK